MNRILVSGGGPAGCIAARSAALNGGRVCLYEEHRRIGEPVQCSGLISKKGLDSIGVNYSAALLNEIRGADVHAGGASMRILAGETKAFVLDRANLDCAYAEAAEKEGVRIVLGERAPLHPSGGEILIGADGVFSRTAAANGFPEQRRLVVCYQREFTNAKPADRRLVSVYLTKLSPGFFGWVIPINEERVRVGLGVSKGGNPKRQFEKFIGKLNGVLDGAKPDTSLAGFIPLSPRTETVSGDVMLVGDAAGQVKALSGGGVYFGCSCASIAGKVAALHPENLWRYEQAWRREFSRDLQVHGFLRGALDAIPEFALGLAIRAGGFLGADGFLVRYGDMDRPSEIARAFREDSASRLGKRFNNVASIFTSSELGGGSNDP